MPLISLLFPLWMAATGAFAVVFYRRRRHASWIPAGVGARLGVLAGAIGFLPFALVVALEFLFMSRTGMMREIFSRVSTSNPDPEVQQRMQQMVAWLQTPQGAAIAVVGALVFCFVGFVVLGTLGGAIWANMTGKREQQ
jgi:ABC-type sugar transport system permease subunit